ENDSTLADVSIVSRYAIPDPSRTSEEKPQHAIESGVWRARRSRWKPIHRARLGMNPKSNIDPFARRIDQKNSNASKVRLTRQVPRCRVRAAFRNYRGISGRCVWVSGRVAYRRIAADIGKFAGYARPGEAHRPKGKMTRLYRFCSPPDEPRSRCFLLLLVSEH